MGQSRNLLRAFNQLNEALSEGKDSKDKLAHAEHIMAFLYVLRYGKATAKEIRQACKASQPTASRILEKIESAGLLYAEKDGVAEVFFLTEAGKSLASSLDKSLGDPSEAP